MVHSRRVMVARARPRASRSLAKHSMSARRTANSGRERARHQVVNWRRSSAYASRVSPLYPARKPARASRSWPLKGGWMGTRAAVVVIGCLPVRLRPEGWASCSPGDDDDKATDVKPPCPSPHVALLGGQSHGNGTPDRRLGAFPLAASRPWPARPIDQFCSLFLFSVPPVTTPECDAIGSASATCRGCPVARFGRRRSEEHTSELQSPC